MTAALKERNFEIAESSKGETYKATSTAGPWTVVVVHLDQDLRGPGLRNHESFSVDLYHYGFSIATLSLNRDDGRVTVRGFRFQGRESYGLSQSDQEGIELMLRHYVSDESELRGYYDELRDARRKNSGGRHPYSDEIQLRRRMGAGDRDAYPFSNSGEDRRRGSGHGYQ